MAPSAKRAALIGFDCLIPKRLQRLLKEGGLDNFRRFIKEGSYMTEGFNLPTVTPPSCSLTTVFAPFAGFTSRKDATVLSKLNSKTADVSESLGRALTSAYSSLPTFASPPSIIMTAATEFKKIRTRRIVQISFTLMIFISAVLRAP